MSTSIDALEKLNSGGTKWNVRRDGKIVGYVTKFPESSYNAYAFKDQNFDAEASTNWVKHVMMLGSTFDTSDGGLQKAVNAIVTRKRLSRTNEAKKGVPSRADCTVDTWFERDRAHVAIECDGETVAEWWDDDVQDMVDSGFFKSGRGLEASVLDYAQEQGLISESSFRKTKADIKVAKSGGEWYAQVWIDGKLSSRSYATGGGTEAHRRDAVNTATDMVLDYRDEGYNVTVDLGESSKRDFVNAVRNSGSSRSVAAIDPDRYGPRKGLEGPYRNRKSGKIVYYDAREGEYYDPDSDLYLGRDYALESAERLFIVAKYDHDTFAGADTDEVMDLMMLDDDADPDDVEWGVVRAPDAGAARLRWRLAKKMTKAQASHAVNENRPFPYYKLNADEVYSAYVTAALWSSIDASGEPLDANYDVRDISPSTARVMRRDVDRFVTFLTRAKDLDLTGWTSEQIGHDLWLSRNGHGAGFFDRKLPNADRLHKAAKQFGEYGLIVGDDGKVHAMSESVGGVSEARKRTTKRSKGIFRTGANGVFFIPSNRVDKAKLARTEKRMAARYGKDFSTLSPKEKLSRIASRHRKRKKDGSKVRESTETSVEIAERLVRCDVDTTGGGWEVSFPGITRETLFLQGDDEKREFAVACGALDADDDAAWEDFDPSDIRRCPDDYLDLVEGFVQEARITSAEEALSTVVGIECENLPEAMKLKRQLTSKAAVEAGITNVQLMQASIGLFATVNTSPNMAKAIVTRMLPRGAVSEAYVVEGSAMLNESTDEITLVADRGGEYLVKITGGWAKGKSLDGHDIGGQSMGADAERLRNELAKHWGFGSRGVFVRDDGMPAPSGYPTGTGSFVKAAKKLGIRVKVQESASGVSEGRSRLIRLVFVPLYRGETPNPAAQLASGRSQEWKTAQYGKANPANIEKMVADYHKSTLPGGANEHLGGKGYKSFPSVLPAGAYVYDQTKQEIVAQWKAPAFWVLENRMKNSVNEAWKAIPDDDAPGKYKFQRTDDPSKFHRTGGGLVHRVTGKAAAEAYAKRLNGTDFPSARNESVGAKFPKPHSNVMVHFGGSRGPFSSKKGSVQSIGSDRNSLSVYFDGNTDDPVTFFRNTKGGWETEDNEPVKIMQESTEGDTVTNRTNEVAVGARTLGYLMSDAPQSEKDKIGKLSDVIPPGDPLPKIDKFLRGVGESTDSDGNPLIEVDEAERMSKADLLRQDRKRKRREKRGKGVATGKQRLAAKRNAKKATRAMLKASVRKKAEKTRLRRARLRGEKK